MSLPENFIQQETANLREILEILSEKKLFVKLLPHAQEEKAEIYTAYRAWKCRPMMQSPYDEVYIMHEADIVYVGSIRNVETFAREWK